MIALGSLVDKVNRLTLHTERLTLRRFKEEDRSIALAQEVDPEVMRHIRDPTPREELEGRMEELYGRWSAADGEWTALVVTERDADEMLGIIALRMLTVATETVEIGYRLGTDHHGKGYGTEATMAIMKFLFEVGEVHKIVAYCVAENHASYRIMEKLGMQREALFREYSKLGGKWCDELVYGMLRREWAG